MKYISRESKLCGTHDLMTASIGPVKRVLRIHYESRDKRSLLFDYYTTYRTDVSARKSVYVASRREAYSFPRRSFLSMQRARNSLVRVASTYVHDLQQ